MNKVRLLKSCEAKYNNNQENTGVDTDIFRQFDNIHRKEKIVFVGSSYSNHVKNLKLESEDRRAVVSFLIEIIENGFEINTALLRQASKEYDIPYDDLYWNISHYIVRDITVEWMCQHSTIPVEVYGSYWELNNIVKPFYNGMIAHKGDRAEIYNSAKYALITHPFEINSQQLGEVIACGCIPLVYDCRHCADESHWNDVLMYFKTADELCHIIKQQLGKPVSYVAENFNFTAVTDNRINMTAGRKNR